MTSPGGEVSYVEFFAKLQDRFGVEYSADARRKWSEVVLPPSGKLSVNDWIDFQTRFTLARLEVRDASEADAYRILTNRLTPIMFGWIVEREKKFNQDHPLVIVNIGPGYTQTDVHHSILALIGHAPTEIVEDPRAGKWALTMKPRTHAEALVKYHDRTLAGASGVFRARRLPKTMHTDDVFKFIRESWNPGLGWTST